MFIQTAPCCSRFLECFGITRPHHCCTYRTNHTPLVIMISIHCCFPAMFVPRIRIILIDRVLTAAHKHRYEALLAVFRAIYMVVCCDRLVLPWCLLSSLRCAARAAAQSRPPAATAAGLTMQSLSNIFAHISHQDISRCSIVSK